jgi:hypothetical protein
VDKYARTDHITSRSIDPETLFQALEAAIEASEMLAGDVRVVLQWEDTQWEEDGPTALAHGRQRMKHSARPSAIQITATDYPQLSSASRVHVSLWAMTIDHVMLSTSGTDIACGRR